MQAPEDTGDGGGDSTAGSLGSGHRRVKRGHGALLTGAGRRHAEAYSQLVAASLCPAKRFGISQAVMEGDRIARALARIEAAAGRIESAGAQVNENASPSDAGLAARYAALRQEADAALAGLDRLIAGLQR